MGVYWRQQCLPYLVFPVSLLDINGWIVVTIKKTASDKHLYAHYSLSRGKLEVELPKYNLTKVGDMEVRIANSDTTLKLNNTSSSLSLCPSSSSFF